MPYIPPARAHCIDTGAHKLVGGDLAYALSREIADFFRDRELNYQAISDVRGAVAAALNEFERRVAEPYEQSKIERGGADPYAALAKEAYSALIEDARSS